MMSGSCPCPAGEAKGRFWLGMRFGKAFRLLGRRRLVFVWLIAERIAVGFCDLALAAAMYLLFLRLQGGVPSRHFWWAPKTNLGIALTTSALVVFRALLDIQSTRAVFRLKQNLYTDFLSRLVRGYSEMQWGRFVERNRGELSTHSVHTVKECANFYHHCIEMIAAVVVVTAMAAALLYQSPIVACGLGIAMLMFYSVHQLIVLQKLQLAAANLEHSVRTLQKHLLDMFSSGKEIRTYKNHAFFYERVGEQAEGVAAGSVRVTVLPQIARILTDQSVVLLFLCIVIVVQLQHGSTSHMLSLLVFYFVLSRRLLPLISHISFMSSHMESSYETVKTLDSELSECLLYHEPLLPLRLPANAEFAAELDDVSFSFQDGVPIVRNATFRLRKGERVLLQGPSGSGKSSLLNLIAGVSQPTSGVVRVDPASLAYVPQEVSLLDDSIRSNLLFGLPNKSDAELMRALTVARLDDFVASEPLGLETRIGDSGVLFSGGQRQRLGLARAILRGATLLLLDEATSALDEATERQVLENLSSTGMTILFVTHRTHTQSFADRVLRIQEGCLTEQSSPASRNVCDFAAMPNVLEM
jgi:ABC-type bacteriocin/lantibiotic exporter with double-glycine peptidase domain